MLLQEMMGVLIARYFDQMIKRSPALICEKTHTYAQRWVVFLYPNAHDG
jgi:hypothetical protein